MKKGLNRRDFLKLASAGAAAVSLPTIISGCASNTKQILGGDSMQTSAHTTYFDSFGVDIGLIQRIVAKGMSRGGDFCDVFLQHKINLYCELGIINLTLLLYFNFNIDGFSTLK